MTIKIYSKGKPTEGNILVWNQILNMHGDTRIGKCRLFDKFFPWIFSCWWGADWCLVRVVTSLWGLTLHRARRTIWGQVFSWIFLPLRGCSRGKTTWDRPTLWSGNWTWIFGFCWTGIWQNGFDICGTFFRCNGFIIMFLYNGSDIFNLCWLTL